MARVAPTFIKKLSLNQEGTTVVFTAEVEAVPKPTTAWFRGETKVEASDRIKAKAEQVGRTNKYKLTLTIQNATADDSGTYKVEAKNAIGKKFVTIDLDLKSTGEKQAAVNGEVGDKPVIDGALNDLTVNQGQKIEYVVKVTGTKPITVTWYRNETKLKSSVRMKITFSATTGDAKFVVMEADGEDEGSLRVEATNAAGAASLSTTVTVILPEKLKGQVKQKAKADEEGQETVTLKGFRRDSELPAEGVQTPERRDSALPPHGPGAKRQSVAVAQAGAGGAGQLPSIIEPAKEPGSSGKMELTVPDDKLKQRRGSKVQAPAEEDSEVSKYFKVKPQNQVVKLGDTMKVDCYFLLAPPKFDWYRGAIPVKTDPRVTITYDPDKLYALMQLIKCKFSDEAKFEVRIEDEKGEEKLEFAGFSVFVKDPKDSGLDFRNLLKHKDHRKRRGEKDDPDWGDLKHLEKEGPEYQQRRRLSAIDLSRSALKPGAPREREPDHWIDELEDVTCQEKESKVELACKFSKPTAKVRWYKNKLEVFQGPKYNMTAEDGVFRMFINRIGRDDAGKYTCQADVKYETSSYLLVEAKRTEYFFTQKLPKTINVKKKKVPTATLR